MLSEQFIRAHGCWVELLHQRISIFRETGRENDEFVQFVHSLEELGYEWSDEHVDDAYLAVDFDWKCNVGIFNWLER